MDINDIEKLADVKADPAVSIMCRLDRRRPGNFADPLRLDALRKRAIAAVLPFQGMISTPALTYLGKLDGPTTALMLAVQAAWAVGLIVLGRLVWGRAVRVVTINGG